MLLFKSAQLIATFDFDWHTCTWEINSDVSEPIYLHCVYVRNRLYARHQHTAIYLIYGNMHMFLFLLQNLKLLIKFNIKHRY